MNKLSRILIFLMLIVSSCTVENESNKSVPLKLDNIDKKNDTVYNSLKNKLRIELRLNDRHDMFVKIFWDDQKTYYDQLVEVDSVFLGFRDQYDLSKIKRITHSNSSYYLHEKPFYNLHKDIRKELIALLKIDSIYSKQGIDENITEFVYKNISKVDIINQFEFLIEKYTKNRYDSRIIEKCYFRKDSIGEIITIDCANFTASASKTHSSRCVLTRPDL